MTTYKLPRLKIGAAYYVAWDDTMIRNDWTADDTANFLDDPPDTEFHGWYAGRNHNALVFIMHRDVPPGTTVGERVRVPKGMVTKILKVNYGEI